MIASGESKEHWPIKKVQHHRVPKVLLTFEFRVFCQWLAPTRQAQRGSFSCTIRYCVCPVALTFPDAGIIKGSNTVPKPNLGRRVLDRAVSAFNAAPCCS